MRNRILCVILVLALLSTSLQGIETPLALGVAHASGEVEDYLNLSGNGKIRHYSGDFQELIIPSEIEGVPVVGISENVFYGQEKLTGVHLPQSIETIGEKAFANCTGLTALFFPDSLISIGCYAFDECWHLSEVTLNDGLLEIQNGAFQDCRSLKYIEIPETVNTMGGTIFAGSDIQEIRFLGECPKNIDSTTFSDYKQNCYVKFEDLSIYYPAQYADTYSNVIEWYPEINWVAESGSAAVNSEMYLQVDAGLDNGLAAVATGGRGMDVNITSNTEWYVRVIDGQNWISLSCDSGYGNGSFYTLIAENLDGFVREGWIEVTASECEPINIKVTQGYEANNTTNEEATPSYESLLEGDPVVVASLGNIDTYKASGPFYNWLTDLHLEVSYNGRSIYGTDTIQLVNGTSNQLIMKPLGDVSEILYIDVLKINEEDTLKQPRWIDTNCSLQNDGTYVFSFKDSVLSYRNMHDGEVIATVKMNTGEYRRLILCNFECDFSFIEADDRSTVDGITIDVFYGENNSGEAFKGLMSDDGTYQSAVWISENYEAVTTFDPKGFLGLFKDKIDSNYVVEIGKGRYVIQYAFSHILYLSPEDIISYSYFMDKETEIRGWYGLIYVLCSCVDIDITKYLPYEDFLMLLFDQNVHTEDTKIDFFAAAELVADYLIKIVGEKFKDNIVISILSDCKSFIRIDELSRAATNGGIIEVAKKWRNIIDTEALYTKIKEWGFKYESKSLLEYLGSAAEDVIGALSKSIEISIKAGIALGGTGWQIKNKNAMQAFVQNNNAPIAIAFFYSPVHEEFQCYMFTTEGCESDIDSLRVGAYDFSRVNNEIVGLENWDGLNMLYSPVHNSGTQKGYVSFDRELIWHMLLEYIS